MLNVDLSEGTKKPRKGFRTLTGDTAYDAALRCLESTGNGSYILRVGVNSTPGTPGLDLHVQAKITDLDGNAVGGVDLTDEYGEPGSRYFRCSIVDAFLGGNPVLLVFTKHSSYIFEPDVDDTTLRQFDLDPVNYNPATGVNSGGDAIKVLSGVTAYWTNRPFGEYATYSDGQVWLGGWDPRQVGFELELDTDQDDVDEQFVTPDSRGQYLTRWMATATDRFDPASIAAKNTIVFEPGEQYRGSRNLGEQHFLFTDKSIYSRAASGNGDSVVRKVAEGVGCESPHAIQVADGAIYYVSFDGIYVFAGGQPQKLSRPVDWLFNGEAQDPHVPALLTSLLDGMKHPWVIDRGKLGLATSAHIEEIKQIWFNLPLKGGYRWLCLVLDYNFGTPVWSIYARQSLQPFFVGHHRFRGKHYFSSDAWLQVYGERKDQDSPADTYIPVAEIGPQLLKGNQGAVKVQDIRFEVRAEGKVSAYSEPPQWALWGSTAQFDSESEGSSVADRQETSGDLRLHPRDGADGRIANEYFLGESTWNASTWTSKGWFMSRAAPGPVVDEWFRVAWVDNPSSADRCPKVHMRGYDLAWTWAGGRRP